MGMLAIYLPIDAQTLDELETLDGSALDARVDDIADAAQGAAGGFDLGELWDGLHFLLTGTLVGVAPAGDNPLSEAVTGVHVLKDNRTFIGYIRSDELPAILDALGKVKIDPLVNSINFAQFVAHDVRPDIWKGAPTPLRTELATRFTGLQSFYGGVARSGEHVLIRVA